MALALGAFFVVIPLAAAADARHEQVTGLTLAQLRARYTLPDSRFVTLGGLPIHYVDHGRGPVVILLHGSFLDLTSWRDWIADLSRDHRVIAVDRLRYGLTGLYPGEPVDYEHEQRMIDALVAYLHLHRFALVGTSSGAIVAAQYADRHPDQVPRLILMNFPLGHRFIHNSSGAPRVNLGPVEETRALLANNLVDQSVITPALVERLTALDDRADPTGDIAQAFARAAAFTEPERAAMFARLRMPVLVMWSGENHTVDVDAGRAAFAAIGSPDKSFVIVPRAGHMMPLEKGRESVLIARRFLDQRRQPAAATGE